MPATFTATCQSARRAKRKRTDPDESEAIIAPENLVLPSQEHIKTLINDRPVKKSRLVIEKLSPEGVLTPVKVETNVVAPLLSEAQLMLDLKAAFRRSTPPKHLLGRDEERKTIDRFLTAHVNARRGGSLYISGCPGAGKTAVVEEVVAATVLGKNLHVRSINCTTPGVRKELEVLAPKELTILILDEIDQLEQLLLYRLFELAMLPTSCLILLGISNSLDLVDRTLPRLRAKQLEPKLLHFVPYGVEAIKAIVRDRLSGITFANYAVQSQVPGGLSAGTVFDGPALELCARKLASSGDVRKVLDTCRRALEVAGTLPVKMPHMVQVVNTSSGASSVVNKITAVALQCKIVLCAVLACPPKDPSLFKLFDVYANLCKGAISPVTRAEFLELIAGLEAPGLLAVKDNKKTKEKEFKLLVTPADIAHSLQSTPIVSGLLPKPK